jgi:cytochrome c oxidase subunit 2
MDRYERAFFWFSAAMLGLFLCVLAYVTVAMHIRLPGPSGRIIPAPGQNLGAAVLATAPFNHPGLRMIGPGEYEVVMIAQQWFFFPRRIHVPAGSRVTFRVTSADVTHGFFIPGTRVNMMIIPGYISVETYRFERAGDYRIICHEYCGLDHQTMSAEVVVK